MPFPLIPTFKTKYLTDLTPEILKKHGIRFLMMDFDNTIVPYTTNTPTEAVEQWFLDMKNSGITLCMVSNSKKPRVRVLCEAHGIPCIQHARKPFWWIGIRKALTDFQVPAAEAAIVGDQIYTDVLGGNGAGVKVTPIGFLVIKDGSCRMINIAPPAHTSLDRIIEMVPDIIDKVESFIDKHDAKSAAQV